MNYLWLGTACFAGPHLFSTVFPGLRDSIETRVGTKIWKPAYAAVTMFGIVFFVLAYSAMGESSLGDNIYQPWAAGKHVVMLLALLMFILVGASHGKGYIKTYVRHPMSLGIALWAGGHLLVNGEKTVVWIFATLLIVALADLIFSFARGKRPDHVPRVKSDVIAILIGIALYLVFLFGFHPYVLGVPVVG